MWMKLFIKKQGHIWYSVPKVVHMIWRMWESFFFFLVGEGGMLLDQIQNKNTDEPREEVGSKFWNLENSRNCKKYRAA
jgi:hypothetical protein